jgi:hypothetical protein
MPDMWETSNIIRVFPRRTNFSPDDDLAFFDRPGFIRPKEDLPVHISVVFTWDKSRAEFLAREWGRYYSQVKIGGPAYNSPAKGFTPGRYVKWGKTITSRGCIRKCNFCMVPKREGKLKELSIIPGNDILDNNLLACSKEHIINVFDMLTNQNGVTFSGGIDIILLKKWHIELLEAIKLYQLFFAYDDKKAQLNALKKKAEWLKNIPTRKKRCYILMGFKNDTPSKADARAREVYELGYEPFAMFYQSPDQKRKAIPPKTWRGVVKLWSRPAAFHTIKRRKQ